MQTQFHLCCISVENFTNTDSKTWFDMLIFHTSFLKLQYLSVFPVKLDIYKDRSICTVMSLRWGLDSHHEWSLTSWSIFWEIFPLLLFSSVSWFVFPTATDKSKGEGRIGSIVKWNFFSNVFFYIHGVHLNNKQKTNVGIDL